MSESIDKKKMLDWIQYMIYECYGYSEEGEEVFGTEAYREGIQLLKTLKHCVDRGDFDLDKLVQNGEL